MNTEQSPSKWKDEKKHPVEVTVKVTDGDIEEMYGRFDSGMADHSTANAIVLALKRTFGVTIPLRTRRAGRDGWTVKIGECALALPEEANHWMAAMSEGRIVRPFSFKILLPGVSRLHQSGTGPAAAKPQYETAALEVT